MKASNADWKVHLDGRIAPQLAAELDKFENEVALKKQGKEALFIRFPDESHELSRSGKPRHRLARFDYILGWFDKHLR